MTILEVKNENNVAQIGAMLTEPIRFNSKPDRFQNLFFYICSLTYLCEKETCMSPLRLNYQFEIIARDVKRRMLCFRILGCLSRFLNKF